MHVRLLVAGLFAATVAGAGAASANNDIALVKIGDGSCPAGYTRITSYESTWVCLRNPTPPDTDVKIQDGPCPSGYSDVGVLHKTVCVRP